MLSLLISTIYFISFVNSCSIAVPSEGTVYISNVELLSVTDYPDQILLTIERTTEQQTGSSSSRSSYTDYGPWCKMMNVNTGTVGDVVSCSDYTKAIRSYSTPDTDTKTSSVECDDNCDGETAICAIIRDGISYTITDIPYSASSTNCSTTSDKTTTIQPMISIGGGAIFISFTIKDISTTYISFATNMVAIQFDDSGTSPVDYNIYTVQRDGDSDDDWSELIPGGFGLNTAPSIYSDVNVISAASGWSCWPSSLKSYNIITDTTAMTQIFTLTSIGSDTKIDAVKARGINYGLYFSDTVTIYDLSSNGDSNSFEPDLCDFIQQCYAAPCADTTVSCPGYPNNARCVDDYCGGCNARWFCGEQDITQFCDSTPPNLYECPDPLTTTTQEPKTTDRVRTTESKTTESRTTEEEPLPECICSDVYDPYCCEGTEFRNSCGATCIGRYELSDCNNNICPSSNSGASIFGVLFIIAFGFVVAVFSSI